MKEQSSEANPGLDQVQPDTDRALELVHVARDIRADGDDRPLHEIVQEVARAYQAAQAVLGGQRMSSEHSPGLHAIGEQRSGLMAFRPRAAGFRGEPWDARQVQRVLTNLLDGHSGIRMALRNARSNAPGSGLVKQLEGLDRRMEQLLSSLQPTLVDQGLPSPFLDGRDPAVHDRDQ
ncbi:hypothetical protein [Halorhodospira sp. 9622]|uniref:hypothetical protein n=1 Tax=Halorhodospira sp. 9622 TaxID=2899136 RepID=UPI001EE9568E|nr:hypothetical protein [Halorhodospira sp. 9622]MCG5538977.1 hypothetical protein [Halorhodospira sp. 9622]